MGASCGADSRLDGPAHLLEGAASATSSSAELPVGPSLLVIVNPSKEKQEKAGSQSKVRRDLLDVLTNGCGCGLKVSTINFPKESPLHAHQVFSVQATFQKLVDLADKEGLPKLLAEGSKPAKDNSVMERFNNFMQSWQGKSAKDNPVLLTWHHFSRAKMASFAGIQDPRSFFTPCEVLQLLHGALNTATPPGDRHPVLLAAKVSGDLDCIMALHDSKDLEKKSAHWRSWFSPSSEPPIEDIAQYFGPGCGLYFAYMHEYAWWLMVPAIFCTISAMLTEALPMLGVTGETTRLPFASTWLSYAGEVLLCGVTVWSTFFCAKCRQMVKVFLHKLGYDTMKRKNCRNAFDVSSADIYFAFGGLHVKQGTVTSKPRTSKGDSLLPYAFMVFSMVLLLSTTGIIIGVLLWVGDEVEKITSNIVLQNLPILLYIAVVGVFEIFYRWLAIKLTHLEQHQMLE